MRGRRGRRPAWLEGSLTDHPELVDDVYNLVTKRAHAYANSTVEWIDANTGSRKTSSIRASISRRERHGRHHQRRGRRKGQHQDTGAKRSISPRTRKPHRFEVRLEGRRPGHVSRPAEGQSRPPTSSPASLRRADARRISRSDTYPYIDIQEDDTTMTHEATVGKISAEQVFYLMSRGLTRTRRRPDRPGLPRVFTKEPRWNTRSSSIVS